MFRYRLNPGVPPVNVEEWRRAAMKKLPQIARGYIEGGAEDLVTLNGCTAGFRQWRLRQRAATGVTSPDLTTTIGKTAISLPVSLSPVGATGLAHWTGEPAVARAAESCGTRLMLSTAGSYRVEEVADATQENHFFQLYPVGGRDRIGPLIERVKAAGYEALFITVDVQTLGNREDEKRWQFTLPWTVTPPRAMHMARHWRWVYDALRHKRIASAHHADEARYREGVAAQQDKPSLTSALTEAQKSQAHLSRLIQSEMTWDDIAWIRDQWDGPLYIKGILDPDDAAHAVDKVGCQGVIVSNHGGRQLDRSIPSIEALPAIAERIGDRAEVFLDGAVRRGTDVITALALGAKAVFIGRPYLYGLAAAQEQGVRDVIEVFRSEITRNLILMGCPSSNELDRSWVIPARDQESKG
ncbi:MAG: alpha-hydroxy-acid oxidizing protein [Sphingomonadaceae bacterium]|nr:alpha-hydroxy-acid oxidizing protein [Sphingomonadaceae bacterium]